MRIQIHKNYFKKYHGMDWYDVPEFLLFETIESNLVGVIFDEEEELLKKLRELNQRKLLDIKKWDEFIGEGGVITVLEVLDNNMFKVSYDPEFTESDFYMKKSDLLTLKRVKHGENN